VVHQFCAEPAQRPPYPCVHDRTGESRSHRGWQRHFRAGTGVALHRARGSLAGIRRPVLDGLGVGDIDFVAAFAISPEKIRKDLTEAIFLPPNNFPRLTCELPLPGVIVRRGLTDTTEAERVARELAGAEVVLYAAPSGRPETAQAYAEAASPAP
jgi:myo-inositol-1-phosphate synthase